MCWRTTNQLQEDNSEIGFPQIYGELKIYGV
jgi:hypothetical protein